MHGTVLEDGSRSTARNLIHQSGRPTNTLQAVAHISAITVLGYIAIPSYALIFDVGEYACYQ
jgi:hypothetical protein